MDAAVALPPIPEGFRLENAPTSGLPPIPPGFRLEGDGNAAAGPPSADSIPSPIGTHRAVPAPALQPSFFDRLKAAQETLGGLIQNTFAYPLAAAGALPAAVMTPDRNISQSFDDILSRISHTPSSPLEARYTGNVGRVLEDSKIPPWPITGTGALAPAIEQAMPTVRALASETAGNVAEIAGKALPKISDPNTQALAEKFQAMGGKIPLHELSDNRFVRMGGEWLDNLPLSGSTKPLNKQVINAQLIKQMGGMPDGQLLTPANFGPMMDRSGAAIGDIYGKVSVPLDEAFKTDLGKLFNAQKLQDAVAVGDPVRNYILRIANSADDNGVIQGALLRSEDTALGTRIRALPPGDLRSQLSDLQETMRDALARQLTGEDAANLQTFRRQYAIGKQLEPLVAKSAFQGVTPQSLMARETASAAGKSRMANDAAGDMGDLANIGQRFIKEQPTSGTSERGFLRGLAGDIANVGRAGVGIVAGNAYNRLGPILTNRLISDGKISQIARPRELTLAPLGEDIPTTTSPFTPRGPQASQIMEFGSPPEVAGKPAIVKTQEFPLRQETISKLNDEMERLSGIMKDSSKPYYLRVDAATKQNALRRQFGDSIWAKSTIEDAKGLQNLFQSGEGTKSSIVKSQSLRDLAGK